MARVVSDGLDKILKNIHTLLTFRRRLRSPTKEASSTQCQPAGFEGGEAAVLASWLLLVHSMSLWPPFPLVLVMGKPTLKTELREKKVKRGQICTFDKNYL